MRKLLTIFSIFAGGILLIFLLLPVILSALGLDKTIADYFVTKFTKNDEKIIKFGEIDVGYHSIKLDNIQFISHSAGIHLVIRGLQFDYNIIDLLQNIKSPHKAIDRIYFVEPKIVFQESGNEQKIVAENDISDTSRVRISEFVNQFENIDRIHLKEGQILLDRASGEVVVLAKNLDGWVDASDFKNIQVNAYGDLLYGTDKNFNVECIINPVDQEFEADFGLKNFDVRNIRRIEDDDEVNVTGGQLYGNLHINGTQFDIDSIQAEGELFLDALAIKLYNLNITDTYIPLTIKDRSLTIKGGTGLIDSSSFLLSGNILDIFNPEVKGKLTSDQLHLASFATYIDTSGLGNIVARMDADFKLSEDTYHLDANISAPQIAIQSQVINDTRINICVENGLFRINSLRLETLDFDVTGNGQIDLLEGDYSAVLKSKRVFGQHVLLDKISGGRQFADLRINGNVSDRTLNGVWNYYLENESDTLLAVSGSTELNEGVFEFETTTSSVQGFTFSAQVADIFGIPTINYGFVKDLPYYLLSSRKWLADFAKENTIEGIIGGPFNELNFRISIGGKSDTESNLSFTSHVKGLLENEKKLNGRISFDKFHVDYDLSLGASYIRGDFESNSSLRGLVDIDLEREEQIISSAHLNGFHFGKILSDSVFQDDGELFGLVEVEGTLDNPKLTAELQGDRFIINDIGFYKFALAVSADTQEVQIDTLQILLNNVPILTGDLNIDLLQKQIYLEAKGSDIDADYIFQTLFRQKEMISGTGDYSLIIEGPLRSPKIYSDINIKNGEFGFIPFDRVDLAISDSLADNTSFFNYQNHQINVNEFVVLKAGRYHFEGKGNFPVYDDGQVDLELKFDGDFFSFLPKIDGIFADGACFSTIELALEGTPNRIKIKQGLVEFDRGELWLTSVVDHIQNMSGKIELHEGSNQVIITNLRGEVDEKPLVINTVRDIITSDDIELESWYFRDIDLDFGILAMETPEGGVSIEIPGFMIDGERGDISISGRTDEEKFYFAGPVRKPYAWGSAVYSNSRFTFPFISKGDGEPSPTVKFLSTVHWDVIVSAGQDLEYVRKIPAFFGEVDTEAGIDPRSEGLHLVGVIKDGTFKPYGGMHSSRGRIDYLDLNFRVENFGVLFKSSEEFPEVYGKAYTTIRDSVGAIPKTIYLELYAFDEETGQEKMRARWEDFRFRLVSADPTIGETQEQVLAYLGYSVDNIKEKATEVGGAVTDNYIIRPLLRPLERNLEKYLGIDLIRFNSGLAKNLFMAGFGQTSSTGTFHNNIAYNNSLQPYALLLQSSEVTVGKYLSRDLYLFYTGQVVASTKDNQSQFDFNHSVGLEYRFLQNLLVEFEYYRETFQYYQIYSEKSYLEDFKIRLRHSFAF